MPTCQVFICGGCGRKFSNDDQTQAGIFSKLKELQRIDFALARRPRERAEGSVAVPRKRSSSSTEALKYATQPGKVGLGSFSGRWRDQVRDHVIGRYTCLSARTP